MIKKYWENMQCFRCLQKGCLALHFTKKITNANSAKTFYDKKINSIKSSKSIRTNQAASITKILNSQIKIKKVFANLNTRIE